MTAVHLAAVPLLLGSISVRADARLPLERHESSRRGSHRALWDNRDALAILRLCISRLSDNAIIPLLHATSLSRDLFSWNIAN